MIKSPLRYPGGKSRAIKKIAPLIPDFKEFREPFVGGGSVFLYVKQKFPFREYWINDIYRNLFLLWQKAQLSPDQLIDKVQYWKDNSQDGKELFNYLLENIERFDDLDKAAAFFVFNRITFSGTTESGGFSSQAFYKRFTQSSIERLREMSKILDNIRITNLDYQDVIEADGNNVFLFLDPPYYSATKSALYGKNGNLHKIFDHERFATVLKNSKHKWLITYDNSEYIKKLFSFANIMEWNLTYGMRNAGGNKNMTGKELFIANYSIEDKTFKKEKTLFE